MGSFFSICCRQTGHFFCHIALPSLFFKLVTGPISEKSVPSGDPAACLNRHKSKSVPNCTAAILSTRYSAEAHKFARISSVYIAMKKTKVSVLLFVLAGGSLLFGIATYALSGDAAEESFPRGRFRDAHRDESSRTDRIPGAQSAEAVSVAGHDPEQA